MITIHNLNTCNVLLHIEFNKILDVNVSTKPNSTSSNLLLKLFIRTHL